MDLEALDRRRCARLIGQEVERMKARSRELFNYKASRSILTSQLNYLADLRVDATPDEAREIDARVEGLQVRLTRINPEAVARGDNEEVETSLELSIEASEAESETASPQYKPTDYALLFNRVLEKRKRCGEKKTAILADWLKEHTSLSRTQLTDYLGGRITGRVSASRCKEIEAAIVASATKLGLTMGTSSD